MIEFDSTFIRDNSKTLNVAVSMGIDSVVFSHFLSRSARDLNLVYINHGTEYADKAGHMFHEYFRVVSDRPRGNTSIVIKKGENLEDLHNEADYREYRYGLFKEYFQTLDNSSQLVVCHHLGDCVESYLMNAFNGKSHYPIPRITDRGDYEVIRPFLKTSKADIIYYAEKHDLMKWVVEDPSNHDLSIRRNWVRHRLLPIIKEEYEGIEKVVKKKL